MAAMPAGDAEGALDVAARREPQEREEPDRQEARGSRRTGGACAVSARTSRAAARRSRKRGRDLIQDRRAGRPRCADAAGGRPRAAGRRRFPPCAAQPSTARLQRHAEFEVASTIGRARPERGGRLLGGVAEGLRDRQACAQGGGERPRPRRRAARHDRPHARRGAPPRPSRRTTHGRRGAERERRAARRAPKPPAAPAATHGSHAGHRSARRIRRGERPRPPSRRPRRDRRPDPRRARPAEPDRRGRSRHADERVHASSPGSKSQSLDVLAALGERLRRRAAPSRWPRTRRRSGARPEPEERRDQRLAAVRALPRRRSPTRPGDRRAGARGAPRRRPPEPPGCGCAPPAGRRRTSSPSSPGARAGAGREFACAVDSEPSCPVFMACSMSSASPPRTSPTMIRSGRMRSALRTRSRTVTSPRPSTLAGGPPGRRRAAWPGGARRRPRS